MSLTFLLTLTGLAQLVGLPGWPWSLAPRLVMGCELSRNRAVRALERTTMTR